MMTLFGYPLNTSSHWDFFISILPLILKGLVVTVEATILGFLVALALGLVFALLRRVPIRAVSWPTIFVIEFVRDTPLLVQLYFLYFVLPMYGVSMPAFVTGLLALGIQYSAYTSEVYRAGLDAVDSGQWEAAKALNLSTVRTYRDVVIPQAIPRVIPAMGNYLVSMIKDTPVLSAVTVLEMLSMAQMIGDRVFRYFVPLTTVGIFFLIVTLFASALVRFLERILPRQGIPLK